MDAMECFLHSLRLHWYLNYIYIYICNLLIGLNSKVNFLREMDIYFKLFHFREKCNNINKRNNLIIEKKKIRIFYGFLLFLCALLYLLFSI